MSDWLINEDKSGEGFGRRLADKLLFEMHKDFSALKVSIEKNNAALDATREEVKSMKEFLINTNAETKDGLHKMDSRVTILESRVDHIEEKVKSNSEEIKSHETPEEFLHKKSYGLILAAGAALVGVLISKLGAVVDWFRSL